MNFTRNLPGETWKPARGWEGLYAVSNLGRVRSLPRWRSPQDTLVAQSNRDHQGYMRVNLYTDSRMTTVNVHLLVLTAFAGTRPEGLMARHLDGDKKNNRAGNLAWGTQSENEQDKLRHGTNFWANKTHCPQQHPYSEENTRWQGNKRQCRTCHREDQRARYYRNKALAA